MSDDAVPLYRLLAPRFWGIWAALALLRLIVMLPYRLQAPVGRAIGRGAMLLARRRRRIAARNIALCFPEWQDQQRELLLRRHFESLGMTLIEMGLCWWASDERLRPLVEIEGLEHLRAALEHGKGVIMLTGHFTTLDLGGRFLTMQAPVTAMYRPNENPLFNEIMRRGRERSAQRAIPKQDIRGMVRALRENHAIWYAPDQSHRRGHSALVPFFSIPAPSNTATSALAKMSGARVVPFLSMRLPDDRGYRFVIEPALSGFPGDDAEADTLRINQWLERRVRLAPEQYLWIHRRFKPWDDTVDDPYAGI
ncbi:MAG: LpxL/LpxP family Kdo(2)-lipid IV(A) lauroyl/palmitoleoyl acyltransferase [Gammaproteobacteria bacterium]